MDENQQFDDFGSPVDGTGEAGTPQSEDYLSLLAQQQSAQDQGPQIPTGSDLNYFGGPLNPVDPKPGEYAPPSWGQGDPTDTRNQRGYDPESGDPSQLPEPPQANPQASSPGAGPDHLPLPPVEQLKPQYSPYDPRRFQQNADEGKTYFMARPNFHPGVNESMQGGVALHAPGETPEQVAEALAQQGHLPFRNKAEYDAELAKRADAREKYVIAGVENGTFSDRSNEALQEYGPAKQAQQQKQDAANAQTVEQAQQQQGMSPQAKNQMAALMGQRNAIANNAGLTPSDKAHLTNQINAHLAPLLQQQAITQRQQQQQAQHETMTQRAQNTAMNTGEWQAYMNKTLSHVNDGVGGVITSFMTPDGKTHTHHAAAPKSAGGADANGVVPFDEKKHLEQSRAQAEADLAREGNLKYVPLLGKDGKPQKDANGDPTGKMVENPDWKNLIEKRAGDYMQMRRTDHAKVPPQQGLQTTAPATDQGVQPVQPQPAGQAAPAAGPAPQGAPPPQPKTPEEREQVRTQYLQSEPVAKASTAAVSYLDSIIAKAKADSRPDLEDAATMLRTKVQAFGTIGNPAMTQDDADRMRRYRNKLDELLKK